MNTREQFGKYLLLKKLTEDPLGETFRAGMLGEGGMERVALLRIFNGQGVDGQRLWEAVKGRAEIPKLLRNPNIGEGVEMGEIQGLPYVAYDYISGKNMATLLEQAAKKRNFIPAEHALLITERAALALAAASETRFQGSRIHHGFVCPHLVMISNEGETRLLGFEVAPGLRTFSANPVIRQHFGRYLAPEALGGQPPHPADDVYSLGVMLFELITGRPLPPPVDGSFGPVIEQGTVATEGTPIPDDVAGLLKSSLVPRDQRVADVGSWHKALNKLMFEGQYNPTTFNLAFFMHNLFRQDIERESQEIEVEKTLPLPTVQKQQAPPPAAPPAEDTGVREGTGTGVREGTGTGIREGTGTGVREATGVNEATENFIPEYAKDQEKSKLGLIVAAVVLLLAVGVGAYFLLGRGGQEEPAPVAATPPPPPPAPLEPEEPSGPTVEEINAKIQELVEQQSAAMEDELRKGYEEELSDLRNQLDRTRREAEERRRREEERAEQLAAEEAAAEAEDAEQTADAGEGAEAAADQAPGEAAGGEAGAAGAAEEGAGAETQLAEQQPPPPEPEPEVATPPPPPPPAKATTQKSQVRRGDLVEPGPGVAPPKLVRQPPARFPEQARRMRRSGATVLVRALVDENGRVIDTKLVGEKHGFGFDAAAVNAVEKSLYKPATKDGVPVKIWHTVAVEFRN